VRFVWAVIAFVLAAALIGAGIAQRTVFLGPDTATTRIEITDGAPYTLVEPDVLRAHQGTQTLEVSGSDRVFLAYGRTADMEAWLSDAPFVRVTMDDSGDVETEAVDAAQPSREGDEFAGRDPQGADLWLEEYTGEQSLRTRLQLPEDVSLLIASDGKAPAPSEISIVWPISNATPWAGPLVVAGGLMLLLGVILYILGVRHVRRSRGPRRKGPVLPPTEPLALGAGRRRRAVAGAEPRAQLDAGSDATDTPDGDAAPDGSGPAGSEPVAPDDGASRKRDNRRGGRALIALPAMALTAALLTGCSPEVWPQLSASPTPSPTPTVVTPANQQPPALTDAQAARIVQDIAATVAKADETRDADLAATRLDGIALEMRKVNYRIRQEVEDHPAPLPIPGNSVRILLPQQVDAWPRTAMLIVEGEAAEGEEQAPPSIMNITQDDPWSSYKVTTVASLEAAVEIPKLAPWWLGAVGVPPESSFLSLAPSRLAEAYADILAKGEKSEYASLFDLDNDAFRVAVEEKRAETLAHFNETGEETGEIAFSSRPGPTDPTALATLESGAIVAVTIDEIETVRPTDADAAIRLEDDRAISTLAGETSSTTGFVTTYTDQLFFSVPAQGSEQPIRLLGYASGLRSAEVRQEDR
jgi:hypothetical protein